jgi:SH3 domain-containing YSC84-like protein 1
MGLGRRSFSAAALAGLSIALFGAPAQASDADRARSLVRKAKATIDAFALNTDIGDFKGALRQARGVLVFPQVIRAAEVIGGAGGNGVLLVRDEESDSWLGPAFFGMRSASVGVQLGASTTETVILIQSQRALDSLLRGRIQMGGDASLSLWQNGMQSSASAGKDFAAFSVVKGVYAGVSVSGSSLSDLPWLNGAFYGEPIETGEIFKRKLTPPIAAGLRDAVAKAARPES